VSADPFGRIKEIVNLQSNCHVDVAGVSCALPFPGVYICGKHSVLKKQIRKFNFQSDYELY